MKLKLFNLCFAAVILIAFILNFNFFLMGHPSKWFNIVSSALYIVFWYIFILFSKGNKRRLTFSIIWALFTFSCSVITLIVNINDRIMADFSIPFAVVFLTPLYGVEAFFEQARFLMASIVNIIASTGWGVISFIFLKRIK